MHVCSIHVTVKNTECVRESLNRVRRLSNWILSLNNDYSSHDGKKMFSVQRILTCSNVTDVFETSIDEVT